MSDLVRALSYWPVPAAALATGFLFVATAAEHAELPQWLIDALARAPEAAPEPETPAPPDDIADVPFAPSPGWDDRTALAHVSQVFGLHDPQIAQKLSGVGPVYWDHSGRGTGALIARDLVLTTGHLFAEDGKWEGPFGLTHKAPSPSDGRMYLEACGRAYALTAIDLGSMAPRDRLGLDYAIVRLAEPACEAARILPVAMTPDDLEQMREQIFLNLGSYEFSEVARYAQHPLFADKAANRNAHPRQAVFGVRCTPTGREDTGDVADGSTAVIVTEGCDGVPGGSGGPVVLSRDGGASYSIVGVANSYLPNTEYNNYTRIEGAFAAHLETFISLNSFPASAAEPSATFGKGVSFGPPDPWQEMQHSSQEGVQ